MIEIVILIYVWSLAGISDIISDGYMDKEAVLVFSLFAPIMVIFHIHSGLKDEDK